MYRIRWIQGFHDGEDKQCPNNKVHLQNNKQIYDIQVRYETGTNTNFRVVEWVIDCCLTHFISYWITRVSYVQNHCLDGFISLDHSSQWKGNLTTDEQNYVRSIFRKVISDAAESNRVNTRLKRDVRLFNKVVQYCELI
jgi:hypothetical protein